MSKSIVKSWKFWLGIGLSAFFLWWAFRGIEFGMLWSSMRQLSPLWILASVFFYLVNLGVRAWRWRYIYRHVKKVKFIRMLGATIVGYFANNILPMRLGEVGRAVYIGELEGADKSASLGTIAVERIFDALSALVILAVTFYIYPFPEDMVGKWSGYFKDAGMGLFILGGVGFGAMLFMVVKRELTIKLLHFFLKPFPRKIADKIDALAHSFIDGLRILSSPLDILVLTLQSAVVWTTNLLPVWAAGMAFNVAGLRFTLPDCLFVLVASMVAAAIPAGPGFAGTFHLATQMAMVIVLKAKFAAGGLAATGIQPDLFYEWGLSYAIIMHALYIVTTTTIGAIILSYSGVTLAKLREKDPSDSSQNSGQEEA